MKQIVDQKVKERLAEIQWYKTVDHAVFDVVNQKIDLEVINKILDKLDRQALIAEISKYLAEHIVDEIFNRD